METPGTTSGDTSPARTVVLLVAVLASLAAYANTLGHGFVMDDRYNVVENPSIRSLASLPRLFGEPWGSQAPRPGDRRINAAYYRPLTSASYALDHALWGLRPLGFHLTNLILHALATGLLALLLLRLRLSPAGALAGALLFALHPVHTEAVNLVSYRTELLSGALVLLALAAHAGRRGASHDLVVLPVLYAGALAAKETAVSLPGWLLLLDLLRPALEGTPRPRARELLRRYLPLGGVLAGYAVLRASLLGEAPVGFFAGVPPHLVLVSVMKLYTHYLQLLIVPWPLCNFWDWSLLPPARSLLDASGLGGLIALAATLFLAVALRSRAPRVSLGLGWWLLGLLPFSHLVPLPVGAAERFLYLPLAGVAVVAAELAARAVAPPVSRARCRGVALLGLLLVLLMTAGTVLRNRHWSSDLRLQEQTARDHPGSFSARFVLGNLYLRAGRLDEAIRELEAARKIFPTLPAASEALEAARRARSGAHFSR